MDLQQAAAGAIIEQVHNVISAIDREEELTHAKIRELRSRGYRIVDGAHTITDWRTKEVVATDYNPDDPWPENWYHIDQVQEEICVIEPSRVKDLPDGLVSALLEWIYTREKEARAWISVIR